MAWPFLFHCNTFLIRNHKSFKGACKPTCFDHFKTPNSYFGRWFFFIKLSIILTSQFHCIVFNHFIHFQFAQLLLVSCLKSAICVEICCKSYSTQAISPLVNFTWNSNDSFMLKFTWNKLHVQFMWNSHETNFMWNSCENFPWISHETRFTWNSHVAILPVYIVKMLN